MGIARAPRSSGRFAPLPATTYQQNALMGESFIENGSGSLTFQNHSYNYVWFERQPKQNPACRNRARLAETNRGLPGQNPDRSGAVHRRSGSARLNKTRPAGPVPRPWEAGATRVFAIVGRKYHET